MRCIPLMVWPPTQEAARLHARCSDNGRVTKETTRREDVGELQVPRNEYMWHLLCSTGAQRPRRRAQDARRRHRTKLHAFNACAHAACRRDSRTEAPIFFVDIVSPSSGGCFVRSFAAFAGKWHPSRRRPEPRFWDSSRSPRPPPVQPCDLASTREDGE